MSFNDDQIAVYREAFEESKWHAKTYSAIQLVKHLLQSQHFHIQIQALEYMEWIVKNDKNFYNSEQLATMQIYCDIINFATKPSDIATGAEIIKNLEKLAHPGLTNLTKILERLNEYNSKTSQILATIAFLAGSLGLAENIRSRAVKKDLDQLNTLRTFKLFTSIENAYALAKNMPVPKLVEDALEFNKVGMQMANSAVKSNLSIFSEREIEELNNNSLISDLIGSMAFPHLGPPSWQERMGWIVGAVDKEMSEEEIVVALSKLLGAEIASLMMLQFQGSSKDFEKRKRYLMAGNQISLDNGKLKIEKISSAQLRQGIVENFSVGKIDEESVLFFLKKFESTILLEEIEYLMRVQSPSRSLAFRLSQLACDYGLADEAWQVIEPFLSTEMHDEEVTIYIGVLFARHDIDKLVDVYDNFDGAGIGFVIKFIKLLQEINDVENLKKFVIGEFYSSIIKGLDPIDSNRKILREISGKFLIEIDKDFQIEDERMELKIAKALIMQGQKTEARERIEEFAFSGSEDSIAVYANTLEIADEVDNEMISILRNSNVPRFRAIGMRLDAFKEFNSGNEKAAIDIAERAGFWDDVSAHFLIHIVRHNRDTWIRLLRMRNRVDFESKVYASSGMAPKSDLDQKDGFSRTDKTIEALKKEVNSEFEEEIWECRYGLLQRKLSKISSSPSGTWKESGCAEHQEGLLRLTERGVLPPLSSEIWESDSAFSFDPDSFQPFDFESNLTIQNGVPRKLWTWQSEAIESWAAHGRIGLIEAATGSGKSEVGITIAREALAQGMAVVLVVPRKLLQVQWSRHFVRAGLGHLVDTLGGDGVSKYPRAGSAIKGRILIAVVNSLRSMPSVHPQDEKALIIADEVHLYTGEENRKIFSENYKWRIGLTATLPDNLEARNRLRNYFSGDPVFVYDIPTAINDGVIMPYELILIRVKPSPEEEQQLQEHARKIESCFKELINLGAIPADFKNLDIEISKLIELERFDDITKKYEQAKSATDQVLQKLSSNGQAVQLMSPLFKARSNTLIFSDFKETMKNTVDVLTASAVITGIIDSGVTGTDRDQIIAELKARKIDAIVSPQAMDVGVDIPELSVGMYVGIRRERLNLIQRLGRFLRIMDGKKTPVILIPVAIGHHDDPLVPGNEKLQRSSLNFIVEHAIQPFEIFDINDAEGISKHLSDQYGVLTA